MSKYIHIGGPHAGEYAEEFSIPNYSHWEIEGVSTFVYLGEFGSTKSIIERLFYGYEQHCKAVEARNRLPDAVKWGDVKPLVTNEDEIRDHYTASFLRSCRTVIIGSPFGEPNPITFTYGKHHLGEINDSLEFIARGEVHNANYGRITVICIVP